MENDSCRDILEQGERNEHKNFREFLLRRAVRRVELEERRTPCPRYVQPFTRKRSLPTRRQIAAFDRFRSSHTLHPLSRHLSFHTSSRHLVRARISTRLSIASLHRDTLEESS